MSKEIEQKAIGGLKELYIECTKLVCSIYNGDVVNNITITEYSKGKVEFLPVINWFVGKQFELSLLYSGSVTIKNVKGSFEGLFCDKASCLYSEIRTNIESYWNDKKVLQGYIKGLYSLVSWEDLISKDKACMNWLCNIDKQEYSDNREIFVFWRRFIECKKYLEANIKALLEEYGLNSGEPQQMTKLVVDDNLPSKITQKEVECYEKAINSGMAEKTEDGYKWLYNNGSKASLAYFLYKLFNPNGTGQIPYQRLNKLWNVTRLDSALSQTLNAKHPQRWRTQIESLFTN